MTWDQLAKQAYNAIDGGMADLYPCSFCPGDEFETIPVEQRNLWREMVKAIYNVASEDARVMVVESICSGGL